MALRSMKTSCCSPDQAWVMVRELTWAALWGDTRMDGLIPVYIDHYLQMVREFASCG